MNKAIVEIDDILTDFNTPVYIGGGGQKQVYKVYSPEMGQVTLKIGKYASPMDFERISREVTLLKSIDSVYFPKQFQFEQRSGQRYCIIEEFIAGDPLQLHLTEYTAPKKALWLLSHLVIGMSCFWSRRVVHRDLKPANIMVTSDFPRIIDLGIARIQDATSLTMSFAPFGPCTPNYASPEQLMNRKRDIDHRSDQFTLGIVLGQLLLGGIHPFDPSSVGTGSSIPENILHGVWNKNNLYELCSPKVFGLISRMLGHEPYMRFRQYSELKEVIDNIMGELK